MKILFRVVLGLLAAGIMLFIMLRAVSIHDAQAAIHAISWTSIFIIMLAAFIVSLVKALRFFVILRYGEIDISFFKTAQLFIASQAFTPLPGGEFGRGLLFKKELDIHAKEIAGPVFLQALIELFAAAIWVVAASFFVGQIWGWWISILLLLLVALSTPLFFSKNLIHLTSWIQQKGLTQEWVKHLKSVIQEFQEFISPHTGPSAYKFWPLILGLGVIGHALSGLLIFYIAHIEGAHLSFLQCTFAAAVAALIQGILTVIPGGLGVTEGGLVGIFSAFHISWTKAVATTLVYRLATLPFTVFVALMFLSVMYGNTLKEKFFSKK